MKIISVIGKKDTGKTTLVRKIIEGLRSRGYKVAGLKHAHVYFDFRDKDTGKYRESGAEIVAGLGKETFILLDKELKPEYLIYLISFIQNPDFLVIEGFKTWKFANISTSPEVKNKFTIATVDENFEIEELLDLIEERSYGLLLNLNCGKCGFDTCEEFAIAKIKGEDVECKSQPKDAMLIVDDVPVPLNPFVQKIIASTITGMIKSLKMEKSKINNIKLFIKNLE
ncbi:molybdopterin-guanine dinucleotide biosynthesis protein B [Methanothermus fervidus DSM 2088]|uniref:Molybdopterin-guanine dinucleotide biosynthesis protein B n=1 Tax=Methanothermus fervidus (strain ATCC 43054 / DSM 2088 / JCM 10308 / V24 S) TaxID=523846 RepID=E3GWI7_METFV|nr:molybdopterin-guanine dinucleotide biosynthesis protein B [Methanothermus fervidus]ADP77952.1 molybdopterin-guanine dinucleotide biosynthesis protein B [Methanothermus fervidus DSM 2088]